ncbi:MAG: hypothetical protein AAF573_00025 [Bacteroidota bacterium]
MKNKLMKYFTFLALTFALSIATINQTQAQCPMCRMSAENNLKDGGSAGKGLNAGILYMLSTPYLLVAGLGIYWYRNRRREDEKEEPEIGFSEN